MSTNFSEGQLQQLVNSAITDTVRKKFHIYVPPNVINSKLEKILGWDSAFYFPWLKIKPLNNHRGCNFFIQYKISELLSKKGGEYNIWKTDYLRFKIPHTLKINGKYQNDYNQFNTLLRLSEKGYEVYYITNSVITDKELFKLASKNIILDESPALKIQSTLAGMPK